MGFGGLYISISGLQASRQSLDTVSHNISNANNPNYVRQSVIHGNTPYTKSADGSIQLGTGVNVAQIRQIRDEFLDVKLRREISSFGYHFAKDQILEDVEGVFNDTDTTGLKNVMNDFWKYWNELQKDPSELTIRGLVHESSVAFTGTVNQISNQLDAIQQNLNKEIIIKVDETNSLLNRIASINKQIKLVEGNDSKMKGNDFRDERNSLLDRLAELIPVKSYENSYGETIISLHGRNLLTSNNTGKIEIKTDNTGLGYIYWEKSNEKIDLRGSGELGGYIEARDNSIIEYKERLDIFVSTIGEEVNKLHREGRDLLDEPGLDFFLGNDGVINASNIRVNPEMANFNKIAVSRTGAIGDGDIALEIYKIRDRKDIFIKYDDDTIEMDTDEYYRDLVLALAMERNISREIATNQGFLINSIDERRRGLSSVSLDEEMADMIKFQHSYVANSRVINAIDEMIETVVNRVGLVGR